VAGGGAAATESEIAAAFATNVHFDDETWHALELLARDRKQKFQDLADEAFFDLLKKHGRQPTKEA
jgi:hypothetical protein